MQARAKLSAFGEHTVRFRWKCRSSTELQYPKTMVNSSQKATKKERKPLAILPTTFSVVLRICRDLSKKLELSTFFFFLRRVSHHYVMDSLYGFQKLFTAESVQCMAAGRAGWEIY